VQAWRLLEEMLNKSKSRYVSPLLLAQILVGLNRYDEAIEALGQAAQLRSADLIWLGVRPSFDSIRTHPRFRSLYSQIGLPE
jgi:predicted Zn-dependent protease